MVQYYPFVVYDRPFCVWDRQLSRQNLDFIQSIDPMHFAYVADTHASSLETEHRHRAAIEIRKSYSHGLETLFALIGAALQAPEAMHAWVLQYREGDLRSLVATIEAGHELKNRHGLKPICWESISGLVNRFTDEERQEFLVKAFAKVWQRFSSDFLKDCFHREYNSIKHGFRCKTGGFFLSIKGAEQPESVVSAAEELYGGSIFGTTTFTAERIGAQDPHHIRIKTESQNWFPQNYVAALHLIGMSIRNVLASANEWNDGDRSALPRAYPQDGELFQLPWKHNPQISYFSFNSTVESDEVLALSKNEVLALCDGVA